MDIYDNPEGLEPEDYIEEYGEAGHSVWKESHQHRYSAKKHKHSEPAQSNCDDSYFVLGLVTFIGIVCFILIMLII